MNPDIRNTQDTDDDLRLNKDLDAVIYLYFIVSAAYYSKHPVESHVSFPFIQS